MLKNSPLQSKSAWSGTTGFSIALSALSAKSFAFSLPLFSLIFLARYGYKNIPWPKQLIYFVGTTALLVLISALWSVNPHESFKHAIRLVLLMAGGVLFVGVCGQAGSQQINPLWIISGWFVGFTVLLVHNATGLETWRWLNNVPQIETIYPHVLNKSTGILTVLLLPCLALIHALTIDEKKKKSLYLLTLGGIGILMIFSGSQSCQLGVLTIALFYLLFPIRSQKALRILKIFLCLCILASPFIALAVFEPFAALGKTNDWLRAASVSERLEIWHFIALKIFENPIVGFGFEAARLIPQFDTQKIYFGADTVLHPHNAILQLWLEFGVLGAILGCWAVILIFRFIESINHIALRRIALATFIGTISIGSISWGLWQGWWVMTLFAATGLTVLAARLQENR